MKGQKIIREIPMMKGTRRVRGVKRGEIRKMKRERTKIIIPKML